MSPVIVADPPPGWVQTEIAPPRIAENAGAELTSFRAHRSADGREALVSGCVAVPIPGWVEDMRPAVEARTTALAGAATQRITGVPMDARVAAQPAADGASRFDLRAASDLAGPSIGIARTFVAFDASRVFSCFVTCALENHQANPGEGDAGPLGCASAVGAANLQGSHPPPTPGLLLRTATWAVHHPRPTALGGGLLLLLLSVAAVVGRRRPRAGASRLASDRP